MRDKGTIIGGLFIFLALVTFPIWYAFGAAGDGAPPDLELPTGEMNTPCVEDRAFMRANHMDLLEQWREAVVRRGETEYTSSSGKKYTMSFTGTCLKCHSNREAFCDKCHNYAGVEPNCGDCHVKRRGD